jgi:NAD(P)-dependent dehydrogenase (short-subunit alcohol dehydrogenase family)
MPSIKTKTKTVAITGAGKGLGAAYALHLASKGMNVLVNNRKHPEQINTADQIVELIKQNGGTAFANYASIEDPNSGNEILEHCLDEFGSLDYLINNAGISEGRTFNKVSLDDFNKVLDINLTGTINITHPCFQHIYKQNSGGIIFTTSGAGLYGQHGMPAYSCAKAAIVGLALSLHLESKNKNINVNVISPFALTNMTKTFLTEDQSEKFTADKIAPFIEFLLESPDVSGNIFIAGGGKFKVAKMYENDGISLSNISKDTLSKSFKTLVDSTNLIFREDASESFGAL